MAARVVAIEEGRIFAFEWAAAGHPTVVTLSFENQGPGTVVALTETG
jgi:hypothetical protein